METLGSNQFVWISSFMPKLSNKTKLHSAVICAKRSASVLLCLMKFPDKSEMLSKFFDEILCINAVHEQGQRLQTDSDQEKKRFEGFHHLGLQRKIQL